MSNTLLSADEMDRISGVWARRPDSSIVVPAYNEAKVLATTISSMARAVMMSGINTELLIVDNSSTDDTAGIAERLGARVVHEKRKGLSYARQAGVEHAAGEVILSTDADTKVGPDWTKAHLRHFEDKGVVGVVGGNRFEGAHWLLGAYKTGAKLVQRAAALTSTGPKGHWAGCNMSYRTNTVLAVGGYDPGRDQAEDLFISMKLQKAGEVRFDPSAEIIVVTDGRRFDTAAKVMKETFRKVNLLVKGKLYSPPNEPQTFEDIR